ncbi:hypothetical protein HOD61_01730 [archaeon]|jgi:hypothetical protein|nr:hypothetical protein [archaeon]
MIEAILFYLVLTDSLLANIFAWTNKKWYKKRYKKLAKHLPLTKAWCFIYLAFVLWVGSLLYRMGALLI